MKHLATRHFEQMLTQRGVTPERMVTAPTLSNIFLWRMLAESDGHYYIAYWSVFDAGDREAAMDRIPTGHGELGVFGESAEVRKLVWFAQGWHQVVRSADDPNTLLLVDMRFSEMHTPTRKIPAFAWQVTHTDDGFQFKSGSFRNGLNAREALGFLWLRVCGGAPDWMRGSWPWQTQ